jgi:ribosomal-protein-alanine N-acetyltransferase
MKVTIPKVLETANYRLEVLSAKDTAEVFDLFSNLQVSEYLDFYPLKTLEEGKEIVEWAEELLQAGSGVRWGIRRKSDATFVGTCGFNSIRPSGSRRAEIAFDLSPAFWGKKIMGEVVKEVLWSLLKMPAAIDFC